MNSPSTKLLDFLQNVLKKFRYLGIFYFEKYSSFFMPLFPRLMDEHAAGSRLQPPDQLLRRIELGEMQRIDERNHDFSLHHTMTVLKPTSYNFYFQSVIHGHLHVRVRDEGDGSRLRAHQVHLPAGRLELAGLHCDKLGVSYFRYFELFKHYKNIAYIFTFSTYEYVAEHKSGRHLFEHCY